MGEGWFTSHTGVGGHFIQWGGAVGVGLGGGGGLFFQKRYYRRGPTTLNNPLTSLCVKAVKIRKGGAKPPPFSRLTVDLGRGGGVDGWGGVMVFFHFILCETSSGRGSSALRFCKTLISGA